MIYFDYFEPTEAFIGSLRKPRPLGVVILNWALPAQ